MSGGIVGVATPDPGTNALINRLANPPNPLEQAGQTINALTNIRQYQAQQASADAYRQSVDPVTGEVDLGKYKALLSQGPGAFNFGPLVTSGGNAVGAVGQATSADVKAKVDQLNATGSLMYPLLQQAANGPVDPKQVQSTLDQANKMGLVTPEQYQKWTSALSGMSPEDARGWVLGANMGNSEALRLLQPTMLNTGPAAVNVNPLSPVGGAPAPGPVPLGLSPENQLQLTRYLNEPYDYQDQDGTWHRGGTKLDWFNSRGVNPYAIYNSGNMPAPGSPPSIPTPAPGSTGPVSTVTTGRAPVPQGGGGGVSGPGGGGGAPGPKTVPPVPPPGGSPAQPGAQPSTEALPGPIVEQGQKDYAAALTASRTMNQRLGPLRNAMALLRTNPDLQTGPGQEQWNQAVTGAAAALNLPVPANSTAFQELAKYTAQYIRGQSTAGQTDLGRLETEASNPKPTSQSRDALQTLLAKAIGAERLQTAALDYFNSQYPDTVTAAKHSGRFTVDTSAWLKRQDQTAFAVDEMSPDQVGAYFRGLSGTYDPATRKATGAKADFINSRLDATKLYPSIQLNPNATVAPPPAAPPPTPPPTPTPTPPPPPATAPSGFRTPAQMYGSP